MAKWWKGLNIQQEGMVFSGRRAIHAEGSDGAEGTPTQTVMGKADGRHCRIRIVRCV